MQSKKFLIQKKSVISKNRELVEKIKRLTKEIADFMEMKVNFENKEYDIVIF